MGRNFSTIPPLWTSLLSGFGPGSITRNLSVSTSQSPGLNHSAILTLLKYMLTPAILPTGRDFNTIRLAYGLLVLRQDVRPGSRSHAT